MTSACASAVPEPVPHEVTAVVPVKSLAHAKTRLDLPPALRQALALAFVTDTVAALSACPTVAGVLVVTPDPVVGGRLGRLPVRLATEEGPGGLDRAVRTGVRAAREWRPDARVVVVPGDLPCLRPDDVGRVLDEAVTARGAFVPDRSGTGTTMLVQPPGLAITARYGPDSAARHRRLGLRRLVDAPVRARHDVDTLDDLRGATLLGVGEETALLVAELSPRWSPRWRPTR